MLCCTRSEVNSKPRRQKDNKPFCSIGSCNPRKIFLRLGIIPAGKGLPQQIFFLHSLHPHPMLWYSPSPRGCHSRFSFFIHSIHTQCSGILLHQIHKSSPGPPSSSCPLAPPCPSLSSLHTLDLSARFVLTTSTCTPSIFSPSSQFPLFPLLTHSWTHSSVSHPLRTYTLSILPLHLLVLWSVPLSPHHGIAGRIAVLYALSFSLVDIFLSQIMPDAFLHPSQVARTFFFTSLLHSPLFQSLGVWCNHRFLSYWNAYT